MLDKGGYPASAANAITSRLAGVERGRISPVRVLLRWKYAIGAIVLVAMAVASAVILMLKPQFTSIALVEIVPRPSFNLASDTAVPPSPLDTMAVQTEVHKLQSEAVAGRVIDQLKLTGDTEFNPRVEGSALEFLNTIRDLRRKLFEGAEAPRDAGVMAEFLERLSVTPQRGSAVISVGFTSADPEKAAAIASAVVDQYLYVNSQRAIREQANTREQQQILAKLDRLRDQMKGAQKAVQDFRAKERLLNLDREEGGLAEQQMMGLSAQLAVAKAERAAAEGRHANLQRALQTRSAMEAMPDVTGSPLISDLRMQEATLLRKEADLSSSLGSRHPQLIAIRAELSELRGKLVDEIRKLINSQKTIISAAIAKEKNLSRDVIDLELGLLREGVGRVSLSELKNEADTAKRIYEAFHARADTLQALQGLGGSEAVVVSPATLPDRPASPKGFKLLLLSFVASVGLAGLVAFLAEHFRSGFIDPREIELATGSKVLGLIPAVPRSERSAESGLALEAAEVGCKAVGVGHDHRGETILITSSVPKEGKSLLAVAIARQLASVDRKCILIDCDLRRPRLHCLLGLNSGPGMIEWLEGSRSSLAEIIQFEPQCGLTFIAAGSGTKEPAALIQSPKLRDLLATLQEKNYLTIIDSPPVVAAADALLFSCLADKTIFVVQWRKTPRNVVITSLQELADMGGSVPGIVFSRVDMQTYREYRLPFSQRYSPQYLKHYSRQSASS